MPLVAGHSFSGRLLCATVRPTAVSDGAARAKTNLVGQGAESHLPREVGSLRRSVDEREHAPDPGGVRAKGLSRPRVRLTRTVAWVGLAAVLGACEPADPQRKLLESASTTGLKVLVIGIDGATFDVIDPLVADGRLPQLTKLMKRGVRAPLRSVRPTPLAGRLDYRRHGSSAGDPRRGRLPLL